MKPAQDASKTVLITLGRLPPAIDIARSFHDAGWRVIVAEPFRLHMARTSRAVDLSLRVPSPVINHTAYVDALIDIIAAHDVRLVVPVSEETMHVSALTGRLPDGVVLFARAQAHTLRLHSKHDFIVAAGEAGVAAPPTARVGTDASDRIADSGDYVIKPEFSCSGRGVRSIGAGETIADTSLHSLIVQQHLRGEEFSGFAIARDGRMLVACIYRARIRHGSVAVAFERVEQSAIEAWMVRFISGHQHTGFIAFDFIVDANGAAYGIECNPRATSGLHFVANADIVRLITGDADSGTLRPHRYMQEFWSNWTHLLSVLREPAARADTWRAIRESRDVTWLRRDPWVFLLATFSTWPIIRRALKRRETFAEVLALDIEWRGDDA